MSASLSHAVRVYTVKRRVAVLEAAAKDAQAVYVAVRARAEQRIIDSERRRTEAALVKAGRAFVGG